MSVWGLKSIIHAGSKCKDDKVKNEVDFWYFVREEGKEVCSVSLVNIPIIALLNSKFCINTYFILYFYS